MGYRTTVILNNDVAHLWKHDPDLGLKIQWEANNLLGGQAAQFAYGNVVEICHADEQKLVLLDSLNATTVARGLWSRVENDEQVQLKLLKDMAERMGYRVVRKEKRG